MNLYEMREIIARALSEDIGSGDVTTEAICDPNQTGRAVIRTKEPCVVAGVPIAQLVFEMLDAQVRFAPKVRDGEWLSAGQTIADLEGALRAILTGERTALNLLQRLSGIATLTAQYVAAVKDFSVEIVDTRKTAPALRILDKYAVRVGGGRNHRLGLYDGVLIKSNHVRAAGGIFSAIARARRYAPATLKVEVEVKNFEEFQEALDAGADIIMLDNMSVEEMHKAVQRARAHPRAPKLEASGGVTLENVREIAATGVDFISVGALTHSVKARDIHLEVLAL